MLKRRPLSGRILTILRAFVAPGLVVIGASGWACSSGESGLILGRPLPQQVGGQGAVGGSATAGNASAGTSVLPGDGGGGGAAGGEAGASGGEDPPWLLDACTPNIVFDNQDTTSKGQLFTDAVPSPAQLVWTAAHNTCRTLYRSESEVKPIDQITLVVYDNPGGVASTQGTTMRLSTSYLQSVYDRGVDLPAEIAGILHFTTSLVYQNNSNNTAPGWLVTGIADFVRLRAGLIDPAERARGGAYDGGVSQTTAFFFDYLATRNADIVHQLNQRLLPEAGAWSDDAFVTFMGSDVDTLWSEYQATLP